jgi:DNA-binding transcriptional ArsR family regulator
MTDETPGDSDLAAIGALLADPARARILLALADGRALPASTLASEAGVAASTASSHLGRLLDGGLVQVLPQGRHRYYRLAGADVAAMIESVGLLAPTRPIKSLREGSRAHAMRAARTCYDHLAGRLGVAVFASLIERGWVVGGDGLHHFERAREDTVSAPGRDIAYRLTAPGREGLGRLGVELAEPDADGTLPLRYCVDWTEQRHHLSGAAGRALTARLLELRWLRRPRAGRSVQLTEVGTAGMAETFGVSAPE